MNSQIKSLINPSLFNALLEISKDDLILKKIVEKRNGNLEEFLNALIAGIVCVVSREKEVQETIKQLLETNPEIQQILAIKNDPSSIFEGKTA